MPASLGGWLRAQPVLQGVLPIDRSRVPTDMLAGLTLAALGIPEVLGYAKIAGMPLVTGLYTMLIPMAVFAILGSINWIARWYRPEGALQADELGREFAEHLVGGLTCG